MLHAIFLAYWAYLNYSMHCDTCQYVLRIQAAKHIYINARHVYVWACGCMYTPTAYIDDSKQKQNQTSFILYPLCIVIMLYLMVGFICLLANHKRLFACSIVIEILIVVSIFYSLI